MTFVQRYRILFVVYGLGAVFAMWELTSPDPEGDAVPRSFPAVMMDLDPEGTNQIYFQGMHAMYGRGDLVEARRLFDRALNRGSKMHEQLLHASAINHVLLESDPETIDAAVQLWRTNFPRSRLPDPRRFRGGRLDTGTQQSFTAPNR